MNKSALIGFGMVGAVLYFGMFNAARNPGIFFEPHAVILVFGGTLAAGFFAFPLASLTRVVDFVLWGMLFRKKKDYLKISQDIGGARNSFMVNQTYLTSEESHPFVREAVMFLLNKNIDDNAFAEVLRNRSDYFHKRYQEDAELIAALAKYPVGFGVLGVARSFIESFQGFGSSNSVGIGLAVAVALVPLCLGLALSNFILLPIADAAARAADQDKLLRNLIIDGMILIRNQSTDDHFQAYLRGYLSLDDRGELKIQTRQDVQNIAKNGLTLKRKRKSDSEHDEDGQLAPVAQPPTNEVAANQSDPQPVPQVTPEIDFKKVDVSQDTVAYNNSGQPPPTHVVSDSIVRKPESNISGGHVEHPVKISLEDNAAIDLAQFKFKDLRNELKKKAK